MGIDASIYQNIRPVEMPSMMDSQSKAMNLSALAMQREKMGNDIIAEKQQMEQAKQAQKIQKVGGALDYLAGMKPEQRAAAYPKVRAELVSGGYLDPNTSPEQYDDGFFGQAYYQYKNSPQYLQAQHIKAQNAKLYAEADKDRAASLVAKNAGKDLTPGQKSADSAFAKDAADYYYGGGKAVTEANIAKFEQALATMGKNPSLTGGVSTKIPLLGSDVAQDSINPELAAVRDDIRAAVQGSLKQVLGGQFTEKEGEAIFNRAFNPRLSVKENIKRATVELQKIKSMAEQKDRSMQHFMQYGTLRGFTPAATDLAGNNKVPLPKEDGGLPGMETATAAADAPSGPAGVMIRSPDGRIKIVPPDMVGKAIANGGSRVK